MAGENLDILDPAPVIAQFRGKRLEIRPLTIGKLPAFSRLVRPIISEFLSGKHPSWEESDDVMALELMELHGEAIAQALAIAADTSVRFLVGGASFKPRWCPPLLWAIACKVFPPLRPGPFAEFIRLAHVVVGANTDFFIRAMKAARFAQSLAQGQPTGTDGLMPSNSSSAAVLH